MPTRNRSSTASWLFRDHAVLVQGSDSDLACEHSLYLKLDQRSRQALISFRVVADLQGFDDPQSLSLSIHPDNITQCGVYSAEALPPQIKSRLISEDAVTSDVDVLILSLSLKFPGRIVAPVTDLPISPKDSFRSRFLPFYSICKSTTLKLYFLKCLLDQGRQTRLEELVRFAQAGQLLAYPSNLRRLGGGKGVQETDWQVFHVPEAPPPYVNTDLERHFSSHTSSKRPRARSSPISDTPPSKKRDIESDVSTRSTGATLGSRSPSSTSDERTHVSDSEVNVSQHWTDTTPTPSSPTQRTHISESQDPLPQYEHENYQRGSSLQSLRSPTKLELPEDLRRSIQQIVREVLPDALREALPEALLLTLASQTTFHEKLEALLTRRADSRLEGLVDDRMPTLVQERIPSEVEAQITQVVDDVQDSAELQLREYVDDALIEIRSTRDDCVKELDEVSRETEFKAREIEQEVAESTGVKAEIAGRIAALEEELLLCKEQARKMELEALCSENSAPQRATSI